MFAEAMKAGFCKAFFALIAQFRTQDEPAYCGLASLTMVLNALRVDPQSKWKGVWRWYSEQSLACCKSLEAVKQEGVSLGQLACLARCNALHVDEVPGVSTPHSALDELLPPPPSPEVAAGSAQQISTDAGTIMDALRSSTHGTALLPALEAFRSAVRACCSAPAPLREAIVVNYNRGDLEQTGTGHFSPIGAYDAESDAVLILDTARFKYPAHWVALPRLFLAMCRGVGPKSAHNSTCRGWMRLSRMAAAPLLVFEMSADLFPSSAGRASGACSAQCSGGSSTSGQVCSRWSSLLHEVHDEVRSALRGGSGAGCSLESPHPPTAGQGGVQCAAADTRAPPVRALAAIVHHMHDASHASPSASAHALGGLLSATTSCSVCRSTNGQPSSDNTRAGAPLSRKLSQAQVEDAYRLLSALQSTQMYRWVQAALHGDTPLAQAPGSDTSSPDQVKVTAAHSLSILLLAVCTPRAVLADLSCSAAQQAPPPETPPGDTIHTCCDTADAVWQQLMEACRSDLAMDSSDPVALLRSEVFMLQQQLAQAQPTAGQ